VTTDPGLGPAGGGAAPVEPAPPSLARTTFLALQADVATAASDLTMAIVVARALGPANRGIYFLALFAAGLIALIGNMGMATAAIVFGANQRVALAQLHGMAIAFSIGVGALGAALLLGLADVWQDSVLGGVDDTMLILVSACIAPLIYAQIVGAQLTGMGHVPAISRLRIALAIAAPLLTVPAVVIGDGEPVWPVAAWATAMIAFALAVGRLAFKRIGTPARPRAAAIREVLSFSLRGHLGTLAHQGFLRVDVLFVSAYLGAASVGLYAQASVLAERMSTLGHAVYSSSAARLGSDPPEAAAALAAEIVRVLLVVMVPVALVLALCGHLVMVVLFGAKFGPAATPFAILLPGTVCLTLWYVLSLYTLSTLRRPGLTTLIQGLGFLVAAPLYWVAVRQWGVNGAAVVSTATYCAICAAGATILVRSSAVRPRDLVPTARDAARMLGLARAGLGSLTGRAARSR
jgi:O-antigen/teichoic acid export membrane protein